MLDYARAGDTVVVTAIDRLAAPSPKLPGPSPTLVIAESIARLTRRDRHSHPSRARSRCDMATLAELELELGKERRAASRESRRARQLPATKPPKLTAERQQQLRRLAATGEPVRELAAAFGIGRATAYRYLSRPTIAVPGPT